MSALILIAVVGLIGVTIWGFRIKTNNVVVLVARVVVSVLLAGFCYLAACFGIYYVIHTKDMDMIFTVSAFFSLGGIMSGLCIINLKRLVAATKKSPLSMDIGGEENKNEGVNK